MDQDVAPGGRGAGNGLVDPGRDLGGRAGAALGVADRDVDHLDLGLAHSRHRRASFGGDAERGALGEIAAVGGMDAAAAYLVRAEQDVVCAVGPTAGDAGQSDIFEIGPRRCEDDVDVLRDRIGQPQASSEPLKALGIIQ